MKGRKFKHWMSKRLPPRIQDPLAILESVQAGDKAAIQEMIHGHLALAAAYVARFNRPKQTDDMVSVSWYAVVNAVDRISKGHMKHDNPTAYIVKFIIGDLRRLLAGKGISVKTIQLKYFLEELGNTKPKNNISEHAVANIIGGYPDTTLDIEEEINAIIDDETDALIVDLLRLGYKGTEIAEELKIDTSKVSRRISRIRKRLQGTRNE